MYTRQLLSLLQKLWLELGCGGCKGVAEIITRKRSGKNFKQKYKLFIYLFID